jgi:cardiolipin synthase
MGGRLLRPVRRAVVRLLIAFAAVQAALVALLTGTDKVRKLRGRRAPRPMYPHAGHREVVLESGRTRVRLFTVGSELFDAMLDDIEGARDHVYIEFFIWKDDTVGRAFLALLRRKAEEGVRVCAVFDRFANLVVAPAFKRFPPPIDLLHFRPIDQRRPVTPRVLLRDHRKLLVVDRRVAYVGGFNLGDGYASGGWRDTHLRVAGPVVPEFENAFVDFWNTHRGSQLAALPHPTDRSWDTEIRVHRNDPDLRIFPIRGMYLEAIDRAARRVWMSQGYFVPDRALRRALIEAAGRGADVRVLVPWHSNHVLADWMARRHFAELLGSGVRLFAYRDLMIHAKTATIDGVWSTVGTANLDRLSLLGNYEINVEIHSPAFAAEMERDFETDLSNATELTAADWGRRPLAAKVVERTLESLSPLV